MLFNQSIFYLHVAELKDLCVRLNISSVGAKGILARRIIHFLETGKELAMPKVPIVSCAKKGIISSLEPHSLMLKGAYKNDLATRLFFKKLIGDHFHFTAFGIDWLNERWLAGNPPSYQEFARFWQEEMDRRKKTVNEPKQEWQFITFLQNKSDRHGLSHGELMLAWKQEREKHKKFVENYIELQILHLTVVK
ncbi:hypothetical protein FJ366_00700 [Candidatus Dependentiae bacterium]|nr:hypothetical protein [Candidatus Dependentiae bacterium]